MTKKNNLVDSLVSSARAWLVKSIVRLVLAAPVNMQYAVMRAALVSLIDERLLQLIEVLVREADKGDISGEEKAAWVRRVIAGYGTDISALAIRTPPHLVNLAIEYAALTQTKVPPTR